MTIRPYPSLEDQKSSSRQSDSSSQEMGNKRIRQQILEETSLLTQEVQQQGMEKISSFTIQETALLQLEPCRVSYPHVPCSQKEEHLDPLPENSVLLQPTLSAAAGL
ncbi:MAG: hypothetical protein QRY72_01825 [Candidatus Rhabdochlamydia sp.]